MLKVLGIMLVGATQVGRVLKDRIGFRKSEIAIQRCRHCPVRVDREIFGSLMGAGEIVDVLEFILRAKQVQPRQHLAAVDGARVEIHL